MGSGISGRFTGTIGAKEAALYAAAASGTATDAGGRPARKATASKSTAQKPGKRKSTSQKSGKRKSAVRKQDASASQGEERRWTYNQRTGQLRDSEGKIYSPKGYSGDKDHKNKPEFESERNKGPIPKGNYKLGKTTGNKGPLTIVLTPDGHDALGRTDFRIHGDNKKRPGTASTGCIILNWEQRNAILESKAKNITVVDEPEW